MQTKVRGQQRRTWFKKPSIAFISQSSQSSISSLTANPGA